MTEDVDSLIRAGCEHLAQGLPRAALFHFQAAITLTPQDPEPHCYVGQIHLRLGQTEEALSEFQRAAELDPDNAETYAGIASALRQRGDRAGQSAALEYARRLPVLRWQGQVILGDLAEAHRDYGLALQHYRRAQLEAPVDYSLHGQIGYVMLRLRRYAEAREHLAHAVRDDPASPTALYNLGLCERRLHHGAAAHQAFQSALLINPHYIKCCAQLFGLDFRAGRWRSAWVYLLRGIKLDIQEQEEAANRRHSAA